MKSIFTLFQIVQILESSATKSRIVLLPMASQIPEGLKPISSCFTDMSFP